jgi:hypothetical protein
MQEPATQIERHDGEPLQTLDDVRAAHNVVGAYRDTEAARAAILELEQAGVEPRTISLLGAWPSEEPAERARPVIVGRSSVIAGLVGAAVGAALGAIVGLAFEPVPVGFAAGGGAVFFALLAVPAGWIRATGMSGAWRETFAADASGTVAVGVHTTDEDATALAESSMAMTHPLAMNRF